MRNLANIAVNHCLTKQAFGGATLDRYTAERNNLLESAAQEYNGHPVSKLVSLARHSALKDLLSPSKAVRKARAGKLTELMAANKDKFAPVKPAGNQPAIDVDRIKQYFGLGAVNTADNVVNQSLKARYGADVQLPKLPYQQDLSAIGRHIAGNKWAYGGGALATAALAGLGAHMYGKRKKKKDEAAGGLGV